MNMKYQQIGRAISSHTIVPWITIFMMSVPIGYIGNYMLRRSMKMTHDQVRKRIIPGIIIFYILIFVIANVSIAIGVFGAYLINGRDLSTFLPNLFRVELQPPTGKFILAILIFGFFFFLTLWQKSAKKEQNLIQEKLTFQYNNLKSQVNPHFLFNSLNTLSELVYIDAKKADNYIQKLSSIYRYITENEKTDFIALDKEILFIENYFSIQKVRDENKINLRIDIKNSQELKIIPVSLQILVENAIKHNVTSVKSPLILSISKKEDNLIIINNIQRKTTLEPSTKKGLDNLKQRVKLMMNREMTVAEENNNFIVQLPIMQA